MKIELGGEWIPVWNGCKPGGIKCPDFSVLNDECDPLNLQSVNIAEIIKVLGKSDKILSSIL